MRRDVLHKATTALAQQHQVVVVETLNAAGMRAKGGSRKRGLNRALADAALAEIRRMLGYKPVGTAPISWRPTDTFRRRSCARLVGGESQTSPWPTESSSVTAAVCGSIVIWVLRSISPDSAYPHQL